MPLWANPWQTGAGERDMSSVAKMIEKIQDQMDVESAELVPVNHQPTPSNLRMVEALLFAAGEPLDTKALSTLLPEGADIPGLLTARLQC